VNAPAGSSAGVIAHDQSTLRASECGVFVTQSGVVTSVVTVRAAKDLTRHTRRRPRPYSVHVLAQSSTQYTAHSYADRSDIDITACTIGAVCETSNTEKYTFVHPRIILHSSFVFTLFSCFEEKKSEVLSAGSGAPGVLLVLLYRYMWLQSNE
jgi:hypothetical protein